MKSCETCVNWVDATGECSVMLKAIANKGDAPHSVEVAMNLDKNAENDCEYYS